VARALASLPNDVTLVLVGRKDAGAFAEFEAEARSLGVHQRLVTPGYVSRDELAALMSGAAAFVYPSRYEGFGLAPLEAMACGAPVIASRVASLPEVVGEGGVLLREGEPWAPALERVLTTSRVELSARATQQAARFDWDKAVGQVMRVLEQVAGARS
jgi:glycosyltransferase involved in cell wall biosynthesis